MLGLRLVKKTVNQDDPTVYHLFFADEQGRAGSDITFFEFPGAPRGRAGAGMIHTIVWRVGSPDALDFWESASPATGSAPSATATRSASPTPRASGTSCAHRRRATSRSAPSTPRSRAENALQGFDAVRGYASVPEASEGLLGELGFIGDGGDSWEARGDHRGGWIHYEAPPDERGMQGAGTVHHVAWASTPEEHERWREKVVRGGGRPTPVIDRFYFKSIYFREPSGVLFEIATLGPGFDVDEPLEHLGEKLSLPPDYEHLRPQVEANLKPVSSPRQRTPS